MAHMKRGRMAWLAVGIWAFVVLGLGSNSFSQESTSRYLGPLLRWLLPALSADALRDVEHAIRKAAHLVEYAVLAVLAYRALHLTSRRGLAGQLLLAFALLLGVAALDETLQSRVPSRSGRLGDVALDAAGGLLGLAAAVSLHPLFRRRSAPADRSARRRDG